MKYWNEEIGFIEGETNLDIVTAMRNRSRFCSHESIEEFMRGYAERQLDYNSMRIISTSVDSFVLCMTELGILKTEAEFQEMMQEKARRY
jgi:hypothetical protein